MTFTLEKASDWNFKKTITIETLDDLKKIYSSLVIDFERMVITIYDTWIE